MSPKLTVFFIVEPPEYEVMACFLAASLREQFGDQVALVGYCPDMKIEHVSPDVKEILRRMGCEVRPFQVEGRFNPPYPHGNKILATLEPRDTEFSAFFDSDILCLRPNQVENIVKSGCVSLTPAASMIWGKAETWNLIYDVCGMEIPEDRVKLMRQKGDRGRIPYFSSGLFSFPEHYRNSEGKSFSEVWMEIAQTLDAHPDVPGKRPYLDQISLPLAIQKSGLQWNILPEEQHFILGGKLRGDALPEGREIFTVHYRIMKVLKETGLTQGARKMLKKHAGVKRIDQALRTGAADDSDDE